MSLPAKPTARVLMIDPISELGGAERVLLDVIASVKAVQPNISFHVILFVEGPLSSAIGRLGATTAILELPRRLQAIGESSPLKSQWRVGAKTILALLRSIVAFTRFLGALRSEIKRWDPDLIHTNGMKAHLISWLVAPKHVPIIWHMHDFISERPLARRILKYAARRASVVIAISDAVARDCRSVLPSLRAVTIANAIDTSEFAPGAGDGTWLDQLADLKSVPAGAHRIGLVATYARWKGQDVFLRAAARLKSILPCEQLRFYLVGGPIYATDASQFTLKDLTELIDYLGLTGSVGLVGFQREVVPVLRSLDVVVHASTRPEPFGRTILEAMACGRAIVVASGGGAEELIENGRTALTHRAGDPAGLADALATLIRDPGLRAQLGSRARQTAVLSFSRGRLGPVLLSLYGSIENR